METCDICGARRPLDQPEPIPAAGNPVVGDDEVQCAAGLPCRWPGAA